MTPGRVQERSLRAGQLEWSRLAWACGISLALHLSFYGAYELGKVLNLRQILRLPDWLARARLMVPRLPEKPAADQVPTIFVDVSPRQAAADPPKNTRYYSNRNSQAANPDAEQDTGIPKIDGTQTEIPKTVDVARSPYDQLQPVFQSHEDTGAVRPLPGDLTMAKPDARLRSDPAVAEQSRPRTIKDALMQQHRDQRVGEKIKQEGGVTRRRVDPGFDVAASPFGAYDAAFIMAVEQRWFDLLDQISFDGYRRGKVTLQFHLYYDGQIKDMKVLEENVGPTLSLMCEMAISDPAPYDKWPREMRLKNARDYREFHFAFYY